MTRPSPGGAPFRSASRAPMALPLQSELEKVEAAEARDHERHSTRVWYSRVFLPWNKTRWGRGGGMAKQTPDRDSLGDSRRSLSRAAPAASEARDSGLRSGALRSDT